LGSRSAEKGRAAGLTRGNSSSGLTLVRTPTASRCCGQRSRAALSPGAPVSEGIDHRTDLPAGTPIRHRSGARLNRRTLFEQRLVSRRALRLATCGCVTTEGPRPAFVLARVSKSGVKARTRRRRDPIWRRAHSSIVVTMNAVPNARQGDQFGGSRARTHRCVIRANLRGRLSCKAPLTARPCQATFPLSNRLYMREVGGGCVEASRLDRDYRAGSDRTH
jgi:hypothetical protein